MQQNLFLYELYIWLNNLLHDYFIYIYIYINILMGESMELHDLII
jgi:hypothetical protein